MRMAAKAGTTAHVWLYRRTKGRVGGRGMGRLPLLLLTVPGRKTGTPHTVPVVYFDLESEYIVVGTGMGGAAAVPQWFLNLQAAGRASVQISDRQFDVDAHVITGADRERLWSHIEARAPHFAKWQARTGRSFAIASLTVHITPG